MVMVETPDWSNTGMALSLFDGRLSTVLLATTQQHTNLSNETAWDSSIANYHRML